MKSFESKRNFAKLIRKTLRGTTNAGHCIQFEQTLQREEIRFQEMGVTLEVGVYAKHVFIT